MSSTNNQTILPMPHEKYKTTAMLLAGIILSILIVLKVIGALQIVIQVFWGRTNKDD